MLGSLSNDCLCRHHHRQDDLAHEPLVDTVTVTGTDNLDQKAQAGAGASVHITSSEQPGGDETPSITLTVSADMDSAAVGDTITFTYDITNTGDVTITSFTA